MSKKIVSEERYTGMGAARFTAILQDGEWVRVSDCPGAIWLGRRAGVNRYEIDVSDTTRTADFYRSNSGRELVTLDDGTEYESFDVAKRWAKYQATEECDEQAETAAGTALVTALLQAARGAIEECRDKDAFGDPTAWCMNCFGDWPNGHRPDCAIGKLQAAVDAFGEDDNG